MFENFSLTNPNVQNLVLAGLAIAIFAGGLLMMFTTILTDKR